LGDEFPKSLMIGRDLAASFCFSSSTLKQDRFSMGDEFPKSLLIGRNLASSSCCTRTSSSLKQDLFSMANGFPKGISDWLIAGSFADLQPETKLILIS
jgi:hypothetical protein